MSDQPSRTIEEIQKDFQDACLKLGYAEYQSFSNQKDAQLLKERIRDLNLEAAAVKAKETAAPAAEVKAPEQEQANV